VAESCNGVSAVSPFERLVRLDEQKPCVACLSKAVNDLRVASTNLQTNFDLPRPLIRQGCP